MFGKGGEYPQYIRKLLGVNRDMCRLIFPDDHPHGDMTRPRVLLHVLAGLLIALTLVMGICQDSPEATSPRVTSDPAQPSLAAALQDPVLPQSQVVLPRAYKQSFRRIMPPRTLLSVAPSVTSSVADTGAECAALLPPPDHAAVTNALPLLI